MPKDYSWKRLFWYYTGYYDEYPTDSPTEQDVLKKQVLCKQISLSKLKMKKVKIEPRVPFDLQKIDNKVESLPIDIKPPKLKRETKEDYGIITPCNTHCNTPSMSQKQLHHKYGTRYNNLP